MTGGIGAGKTEALRAFARHGAAVLSSDDIVHELFRTNAHVKAQVMARWGDRVLGSDAEIDRERVAAVVFQDERELAWLEDLLHPKVVSAYLRWRDELAQLDDPPTLCVTEVPLLYEIKAEGSFDAVVVVTASPEIRRTRVGESVADRERRLIPDEEKTNRADFAYQNDGTLEELDAFVAGVVERVTS